MIVAGGTYRESVVVPHHVDDLAGSGFRAAAALASADLELVTAVEPAFVELLTMGARTFGFKATDHGRDKGVGFEYFAPFVEPVIHGAHAQLQVEMRITGETALAFGMVEEGVRSFSVDTLVYDPQSIHDPGVALLAGAKRKRFAFCANDHETRALGHSDVLEDAARNVASELRADVVVTKAGARGCLVTDLAAEKQEWVGAIPSTKVWKLGSGDVFSAGFAHAWGAGADPVEAARVASRSAAWWCTTRVNQIPREILAGSAFAIPGEASELANSGSRPMVYLAGPFFTVAERWLVDACRWFLLQAGAEVFSPFHEIGVGGPEVAKQDLDGLRRADVVLALLDGWDPGTLFETGWAENANISTVAVASNLNHVGTTMLEGTGTELHTDITTALYRAIWVGLGAPLLVVARED